MGLSTVWGLLCYFTTIVCTLFIFILMTTSHASFSLLSHLWLALLNHGPHPCHVGPPSNCIVFFITAVTDLECNIKANAYWSHCCVYQLWVSSYQLVLSMLILHPFFWKSLSDNLNIGASLGICLMLSNANKFLCRCLYNVLYVFVSALLFKTLKTEW